MSEQVRIVTISEAELETLIERAVAKAQASNGQELPPKLLFDAREAAAMYGIPETWIGKAARDGRLPRIQLGHYVRFRLSDLENFIETLKTDKPVDKSPD